MLKKNTSDSEQEDNNRLKNSYLKIKITKKLYSI